MSGAYRIRERVVGINLESSQKPDAPGSGKTGGVLWILFEV